MLGAESERAASAYLAFGFLCQTLVEDLYAFVEGEKDVRTLRSEVKEAKAALTELYLETDGERPSPDAVPDFVMLCHPELSDAIADVLEAQDVLGEPGERERIRHVLELLNKVEIHEESSGFDAGKELIQFFDSLGDRLHFLARNPDAARSRGMEQLWSLQQQGSIG